MSSAIIHECHQIFYIFMIQILDMSSSDRDLPSVFKVKSTKVRKRKAQNNGGIYNSITDSRSQLLNQASHLKNAHLHEIKKRRRDLLKRINYSATFSVVVLPLWALVYLLKYSKSFGPENLHTMIFSCIYFNLTLLAFTSGYHKYFAHNAFKTRFSVIQLYFAIMGSSLGLGPIRVWAALHRAHHQFTDDTERDPYSIKRGFFWAHLGWLIKKPKIIGFYEEYINQEFPTKENYKVLNHLHQDATFELDELELLNSEYMAVVRQVVLWQEKYYFILFLLTTLVIPVTYTYYVCHDTVLNGLLYPGIIRMFLCQQALLSVESVCHSKNLHVSIPSQPFNDKNSSSDCYNPLVTVLTYGQSQQNYHHEFPHDYRASASWLAFDPTKWFIWSLSCVGLVDELCITPNDLIVQLRIQQQQEVINRMRSKLNWGTPISKLPLIKPADFKKIVESTGSDKLYIVIQNIIHDITPFMDKHPGGIALLRASHGKDATKAFYGGVYSHSTAANNLLATMRIGVLDYGNDEELWRRVVNEEGEVNDSNTGHSNQSHKTAEAA